MTMTGPMLEIRHLSIHFETREGPLRVLRDVSLTIGSEETFGLAGESGSGKTTLGYAIMRALPDSARVTSGEILFEGEDLLTKGPEELRGIRGRRIAMVYQDPRSALNPTMTVGQQIAEALEVHGLAAPRIARGKAIELLDVVNIADPVAVAGRYPHQLSGGMQQRVVIAMALACGPNLLIMDEPTTGLDVTTQARILDLVTDLKRRVRAAILYISHDLAVIAQVSDRVGVLYAGELVETAPAARLFRRPAHPYTVGLMGALPDLDGIHGLIPIEGRLPVLTSITAGCIFAPRCWLAEAACRAQVPPLAEVAAGHHARCLRWPLALEAPARGEAPRRPGGPVPAGGMMLLAERVSKHYGSAGRLALRFGVGARPVRAVDDVSFHVRRDEVLALVGESGCGKSTLGRVVVRLQHPTAGSLRFFDRQETEVTDPVAFHRAVQIVFQNPDASLNPMKRVSTALMRPLALLGVPKAERRMRLRLLLEAVRLDATYARRLPRQLSGGEKQRVALARALAMHPEFIVLDEPVSALDVSTQASIIRLTMELRASLGASYLFISHDLSLVRHVAQRVAVMYLGKLVELGTVREIFQPPSHPYTRALLSAIPRPEPGALSTLIRLEGTVPSAERPPSGCRFHTRCPSKVGPICEEVDPPWQRAGEAHWIACHIPLETLRREPPVLALTRAAGGAGTDAVKGG
jgi:peptide/nickel transport system ATP-binding protein